MKKRISIMLAVLMALVFALAGCGSSSNTSNANSSDKTSATSEAKEEAKEEAETEAPAENTVKAFVESEVGEQTKAEIAEAMKDLEIYSGFDMYAEGDNILVYEYKYVEDLDVEATAANLASMHDEMESGLKDTVEGLIEGGLADAECMFRYVTFDGELIYEQKYPE